MSARNFKVYGTESKFGTVEIIRGLHFIKVKLHKTVVLELNTINGAIILNTGGWYTVTTKQAINLALDQIAPGYRVYSPKGDWGLYYSGRKVDEFTNGMVIDLGDHEYAEVASQGGIL